MEFGLWFDYVVGRRRWRYTKQRNGQLEFI